MQRVWEGYSRGSCVYQNKERNRAAYPLWVYAMQEREIGHSCIKGVYLDELDPGRGYMDMEIMEDCTIACQILAK